MCRHNFVTPILHCWIGAETIVFPALWRSAAWQCCLLRQGRYPSRPGDTASPLRRSGCLAQTAGAPLPEGCIAIPQICKVFDVKNLNIGPRTYPFLETKAANVKTVMYWLNDVLWYAAIVGDDDVKKAASMVIRSSNNWRDLGTYDIAASGCGANCPHGSAIRRLRLRAGAYDLRRMWKICGAAGGCDIGSSTSPVCIASEVNALTSWMQIMSLGNLILTDSEADRSAVHAARFFALYKELALSALRQGRCLWKLRPKLHYLHHVCLSTVETKLNGLRVHALQVHRRAAAHPGHR